LEKNNIPNETFPKATDQISSWRRYILTTSVTNETAQCQ
jgi:hypothetical protein